MTVLSFITALLWLDVMATELISAAAALGQVGLGGSTLPCCSSCSSPSLSSSHSVLFSSSSSSFFVSLLRVVTFIDIFISFLL